MAKPRNALESYGQYLLARAAVAGLGVLDIQTSMKAFAMIGRQFFRFVPRFRKRAIAGVATAFPHWPTRRIEQVASQSVEHFAQVAVEALFLPQLINRDTWSSRVQLHHAERCLALGNTGRPMLFLSGHYGCWEVIGFVLSMLGYLQHVVARPLDNPLVNDWLIGSRQRLGLNVIAKRDAVTQMQGVLDAGESIAIVADQNAGKKGVFVPFFGRLASTHKSIGLLAMQYELPLVVGHARRVSVGTPQYVGTIHDIIMPEQWQAQPDPLYYITARYMRAVEQAVREDPTQYLWAHRRWKTRPSHEVRDKPMPAGLRRKLEALPWMDDVTMRQLETPAEA